MNNLLIIIISMQDNKMINKNENNGRNKCWSDRIEVEVSAFMSQLLVKRSIFN